MPIACFCALHPTTLTTPMELKQREQSVQGILTPKTQEPSDYRGIEGREPEPASTTVTSIFGMDDPEGGASLKVLGNRQ